MQKVRIFISSPGDVQAERELARKVIARLALDRRYVGRLDLKPLLWEDIPLQVDMSFQQGIDLVLSETGVDIAVFILWSRLGSPTGPLVCKEDGTPYRSGTEREFDLMLRAREQSGGIRPAILAYVRDDEKGFRQAIAEEPMAMIDEMIQQSKLAGAFVTETFQDKETGTNIRAYTPFPKPQDFAVRLREHLKGLLDALIGDVAGDAVLWEGEPYRGLRVFDYEHSPIFFGRDRQIADVQLALRAQAAAGCAFLLVVGASGSGKSSLVRAGVLPEMIDSGLGEAVTWRRAIFLPRQHGRDLIAGLVQVLMGETALPELRSDALGQAELVEGLASDPALTYKLRLRSAFDAAGTADRPVRLVLMLDQLEELFNPAVTTPEAADAFLAVIEILARSGRVWVVATVRSDFYAHCQQQPRLVALKGSAGQYDLLPPTTSDITAIITGPTRLAGLTFETDAATGQSLSERLVDDASAHPEALPLLEFALSQLYERRTASNILTFEAYRQIGGVEGALGAHAEDTFTKQSEAVRRALPVVLNALVTISEDDEGRALRRSAPLDHFATETPEKHLLDAFIASRLLITDSNHVTVAHEALFRRWERAAAWITENRESLHIRTRVETVAKRWQQEGKLPDFLLPTGKPLAEAEALLATRPDLLDHDLTTYIQSSTTHHTHQANRQRRRLQLATTIFALLAIAASIGGAIAWHQRNRAIEAEKLSQLQMNEAKLAREDADRIVTYLSSEGFAAIENQGAQEAIQDLKELINSYYSHRSSVNSFNARLFYDKRPEFEDYLDLRNGVKSQFADISSLVMEQYDKRLSLMNSRILDVPSDTYSYIEFSRVQMQVYKEYLYINNLPQALFHLQQATSARYKLEMSGYRNDSFEYLIVDDSYAKYLAINASLLDRMDMVEESLLYYQNSLNHYLLYYRRDPTNRTVARRLADSYLIVGTSLMKRDIEDAIYTLNQGADHCVAISRQFPDDTQWNKVEVKFIEALGEVYSKKGNFEEALCYYDKAIKLYRSLPLVDPHNLNAAEEMSDFINRKVANNLLRIGDMNIDLNRYREASQAYLEAIGILELICRSERSEVNCHCHLDLQDTYRQLRMCLFRMNYSDAIIPILQEEIGIIHDIIDLDRDYAIPLRRLARAYYELANYCLHRKDFDGAIIAIDGFIVSLESAADSDRQWLSKMTMPSARMVDYVINERDAIGNIRMSKLLKRLVVLIDLGGEYGFTNSEDYSMAARALSVLAESSGSSQEESAYYEGALEMMKRNIDFIQDAAVQNGERQLYNLILAQAYGQTAWYALFAREPQAAVQASLAGMALETEERWLRTNLAHGYLFLGEFKKAKAVYLENPDELMNPEMTSRAAVLEDFEAFRKAGLTHPDMVTIEALLKEGAPAGAVTP